LSDREAKDALFGALASVAKALGKAGHIAGARSVHVEELREHLRALPKETEVVACYRGPYCAYADDAVRQLRRRGYRAHRLEDGFPGRKHAGLPTTAGKIG